MQILRGKCTTRILERMPLIKNVNGMITDKTKKKRVQDEKPDLLRNQTTRVPSSLSVSTSTGWAKEHGGEQQQRRVEGQEYRGRQRQDVAARQDGAGLQGCGASYHMHMQKGGKNTSVNANSAAGANGERCAQVRGCGPGYPKKTTKGMCTGRVQRSERSGFVGCRKQGPQHTRDSRGRGFILLNSDKVRRYNSREDRKRRYPVCLLRRLQAERKDESGDIRSRYIL
ncbi:hypothetical protein C8J57DRAFT_1645234 [Mycena rebaudengoi]|nr:hypothetical protein C8J57DRAFT_1645234 [Mycena rebaudengoi]